ncbi:hypothetical protein TNCV_4676431, partial [Trichonephila clavipes]
VGHSSIIKEKGRRKMSRLEKQQTTAPNSESVQSPIDAGSSTSVLELTPQWTLLDMGLHSSRPTCEPLLTK